MSAMPVNTIMALLTVLIMLAVLLALPVLIGVYVYRDAARRGMNAVLWTLVAAVAPALVGFIIYLLVRGGYSDLECPQCGASVTERYVACPKCGARLRLSCPSCSALVERDWKVCPHCAEPLDALLERVSVPRRRQDKALGKILIAVVLVPVVLIVIAVLSFSKLQSSAGPISLQEVTFDEYLQFQQSEKALGEVEDWINEVTASGQRADRAYILQYEHVNEFRVEKYYYLLVYVPIAGYQSNMAFGTGSGLVNPVFELKLASTGRESSLLCVKVSSTRSPMPKITLDGKSLNCLVRSVDYNPTLFYIAPNYAVEEPGEAALPQRLSVMKYVDNHSSSENITEVTDEDMMLKILVAIDSGERMAVDEYPEFNFHDGFEIVVEYQIHEGLLMHEDMVRHRVFMEDGVCYLHDGRVRNASTGSYFRVMDRDFYELLKGLFEGN